MKIKNILIGLIIFLIFSSVYVTVGFSEKRTDELPHIDQIVTYLNSDYGIIPSLTTIPGYNFIIAFIFNAINFSLNLPIPYIFLLRAISLLVFLPLLIFSFQKVSRDSSKSLLILFFPIYFTFYFFIFTDIASLVFILLAFYFMLSKRYFLSSMLSILAIITRQNNIIWIGFIILLAIFEGKKEWKYVLYYSLPTAVFAGFLYINKGVTIGDRGSHPLSFHAGNIWMFLFATSLLFLPYFLYKAKDVFMLLKTKPKYILLAIGVFILVLGTFTNSHPYNMTGNVLLHNRLAMLANDYVIVFAFICMYAFLVLFTTKLFNKQCYLFYLFSIVFLGLSWMIEFRYYMIPWALFMLFNNEWFSKDKFVYYSTWIYWGFLNIVMTIGIANWRIFW